MLLAGQVGGANTVPLITPPHVGGWGGGEKGRGEADWTSDPEECTQHERNVHSTEYTELRLLVCFLLYCIFY